MADLSQLSNDELLQMLQAHPALQEPQPQASQPNTAIDIARSIPGGLAKGAGSILGLPRDLEPIGRMIATGGAAMPVPATNILPGSGQVTEGMASPFGGLYKPQTMAGQYAETISSFAPAALAPGGAIARAARVAIPGAASETGGQLFKGSDLEPYARMGGAILGGTVQGMGEGYLAERAQTAATPTTAQVQQSASNQYRAIAGTPVTITPQMANAISGDLGQTAIQHAIKGADANRETGLVQELEGLLTSPPNPSSMLRNTQTGRFQLPPQISIDAADKISQAMRDIGRGAMRGENPNANVARGAFGRRTDIETTVGQVPEIQPARAAWSQAKKAEDIDAAINAAIRNPVTPAGAGDVNQAMRREFGKLARDENFMAGLTNDEQKAITKVSDGTFTANLLQRLGKFSPVRNHLAAMAEVLGATSPLSSEAIGVAIGGEAARQGGIFATLRNARLASELARGGTAKPLIGRQARDAAAIAALLGRPAVQ